MPVIGQCNVHKWLRNLQSSMPTSQMGSKEFPLNKVCQRFVLFFLLHFCLVPCFPWHGMAWHVFRCPFFKTVQKPAARKTPGESHHIEISLPFPTPFGTKNWAICVAAISSMGQRMRSVKFQRITCAIFSTGRFS